MTPGRTTARGGTPRAERTDTLQPRHEASPIIALDADRRRIRHERLRQIAHRWRSRDPEAAAVALALADEARWTA